MIVMRKVNPWNVAIATLMIGALVAIFLLYLRPAPYLPKSQAELDVLRGQQQMEMSLPPIRIWQQEKEYWRSRMGIDEDMTHACGGSVQDGLVYVSSGSFSSTDVVSVIGDERREAHANEPLHGAYSPPPGKYLDSGVEGIFNPSADLVKIDRVVEKLPRWRQKWLNWHIRLSGILELPYSIPHDPILDGGGMTLQICHEGFLYRYRRTYGIQQIEPAINRLLEIIK